MTEHKLPTAFAPAERSTPEEIRRQNRAAFDSPIIKPLLDSLPHIIFILNRQRQAVFVNHAILSTVGVKQTNQLLGLRPGEILDCAHHKETEGGCGTTQFCETCGAVKAILESQEGKHSIQECRIIRLNGDALDLRVWASPMTLAGEPYTVFTIADIGDEKRRRALERIFFHDLLNSMSGVKGALELMELAPAEDQKQLIGIIQQASERAINEINAQRQLTAAELNELVPNFTRFGSLALVNELASVFQSMPVGRDRPISILPGAEDFEIVSDRVILSRVIGNMLKNALEASDAGQTVTLDCHLAGESAAFSVHNETVMPPEVRLQIFQRSFSTKGAGRGLGTYSIKLLSERYLKGKAAFTSAEGAGTSFTVTLPLKLEKPEGKA